MEAGNARETELCVIVCGFSLVKRKTGIKNSSLENIGDYCDI